MKKLSTRHTRVAAVGLLTGTAALALLRLLSSTWPWQSPASAVVAGAAPSAMRPIRIGMPVGITGANSVVAPKVIQAAQLAVSEINEAGGVLGRPLELEVVDDASGADGAQRAMNQLAPRVDAIIAMETSAARQAALPIVAAHQRPYLYTSFCEGQGCSPWMYANGWVPEQQVTPLVRYLVQTRGARSFFLVGSDYAFGRGMLDFARKSIRQSGAAVAGEEYLPTDGDDWSAVIARLKASHADALISATAGGAPNVPLARQLRAAGVKLPYGNLAIDESTAKTMGDAATGMLLSASYLTGIDSTENSRFLKRMMMKFRADLRAPNELSVPQDEAFHLYKAAAERAGSTAAGPVIAALGEVAYTGPRGKVRLDRQRHAALTMRLGQVRSDGSVAILATYADVPPGEQCPGL